MARINKMIADGWKLYEAIKNGPESAEWQAYVAEERTRQQRQRANYLKRLYKAIRSLEGKIVRAKVGKNVYVTGEAVLVEGPSGPSIKVKSPVGQLFEPIDGKVEIK